MYLVEVSGHTRDAAFAVLVNQNKKIKNNISTYTVRACGFKNTNTSFESNTTGFGRVDSGLIQTREKFGKYGLD